MAFIYFDFASLTGHFDAKLKYEQKVYNWRNGMFVDDIGSLIYTGRISLRMRNCKHKEQLLIKKYARAEQSKILNCETIIITYELPINFWMH